MTVGPFTVNFCRNPLCEQFGVPPDPYDTRGHPRTEATIGRINGAGEERSFFCFTCETFSVIKSNRAIAEEYNRISTIYRRPPRIGCRNESCANSGLPLELAPSGYRAFGTTGSGDPRFQCKACGKTFSRGSPTRRHKRTDRTGDILLGLVNKVPLSRICELNGVSFPQVYSKIDFIHRQCLAMAARREQNLHSRFAGSANFFATDAQTIMVNWPAKSRRGTIPLLHMATVH